MPAKWRIKVYLKGGAVAEAEAQDLDIQINRVTGRLVNIELTNAEGPRLAWVDLQEVAAVVVDELGD
jgi:hypothetical protein